MDNAEKTPNDVTDLGPMTRLSDGNYKQYSSTSLFSITAGDYDGNGKGTYTFDAQDNNKTATAKPLTGYVFASRTGDAAQYTTSSFTTEVTQNMTFGATLVAPSNTASATV